MWELSRTSGLGAGFFDSGLGSSAIVIGTFSPLAELLLNRHKHVPDVFGCVLGTQWLRFATPWHDLYQISESLERDRGVDTNTPDCREGTRGEGLGSAKCPKRVGTASA
jgi:hypothetical protein